ncbi:MAG TPA: Tfx family DNA-binding protein [Euryarchaeota archaeon]|nr:putative transcriptional regulator [archaeon BMS3Bbin15]HDL14984.1 Tfx family DNA-binding protein [Euryarchaeota archaeon]
MNTFLTPMQIKILELRAKGHTQAAIAGMLGTTRANISITEKRARKNVEKANATLDLFRKIGSPKVIEIKDGEDIFNVPKEVFSCATICNIKVKENTLSLIDKIKRSVPDKIQGRVVKEKIEITILKDGGVIIE